MACPGCGQPLGTVRGVSTPGTPGLEATRWEDRPSWRKYWVAWLIVGLAGVVGVLGRIGWLMIFAGLYAIGAWLDREASTYRVTDARVWMKRGIVGRKTSQMEVGDIRNIVVRQRVMERLLGIGDVAFSSAATSELEVVFLGITGPEAVAELVRALRKGAE